MLETRIDAAVDVGGEAVVEGVVVGAGVGLAGLVT